MLANITIWLLIHYTSYVIRLSLLFVWGRSINLFLSDSEPLQTGSNIIIIGKRLEFNSVMTLCANVFDCCCGWFSINGNVECVQWCVCFEYRKWHKCWFVSNFHTIFIKILVEKWRRSWMLQIKQTSTHKHNSVPLNFDRFENRNRSNGIWKPFSTFHSLPISFSLQFNSRIQKKTMFGLVCVSVR